jgi:hypothetical protein
VSSPNIAQTCGGHVSLLSPADFAAHISPSAQNPIRTRRPQLATPTTQLVLPLPLFSHHHSTILYLPTMSSSTDAATALANAHRVAMKLLTRTYEGRPEATDSPETLGRWGKVFAADLVSLIRRLVFHSLTLYRPKCATRPLTSPMTRSTV